MTLASAGSPVTPVVTGLTFPLTPSAVHDSGGDHFIVVEVISTTAADWATALSSSNVTWDASPLVAHTSLTANSVVSTVFKGKVTTAGLATVTVTTNTGSPSIRVAAVEGSSTAGYSAVTLDTSGTVNAATTLCPGLTPAHGAGEFYFYFGFNAGSATAGSTSGYTYGADANGNGVCFRGSCTSGAQQPAWGASDTISGIAVLLYEAVTAHPGAAALSGSGVLTAGALVSVPGAAALAGSGTLTTTPTVAIPAAVTLLGDGELTAGAGVAAPGAGAAALAGTGVLTAGASAGFASSVNLTGLGLLTAQYTGITQASVPLAGFGVLTVAGAATLKFTAGLFGGGFLSIPQVAGGLVNGVGGAGTPQALPGSSQVAVAPPGSANWQWLGTLGQVTALTYSYVCPGGADKMSMTIMVPAAYRTQLFNPGWSVKITRGGHDIWHGKLDEPQPSASGWTLTAVGAGNRGTDFTAYYAVTPWPNSEPDEIINRAVSRGLPWVNPGLNSSPYFSQFWFGQQVDPAAQTVTAFLNLITSRGGLLWYVNSQPGGLYGGDDLSVFPLPTVPNRLLVATTPVARTLGGDTNTIYIRYQSAADNSTATPPVAATYSTVTAVNAQSVAAHGTLEQYIDVSDAGTLTSAAAQAVGTAALQLFQRASFAGPFQASYGQLLNMGGAAVDPGCDQASNMVQMILTDWGYGGEVSPGPIRWIIGSYEWDDYRQIATISPMQVLDQSLSGLLSAGHASLMPVAVASA
jgi:hypothetical protein